MKRLLFIPLILIAFVSSGWCFSSAFLGSAQGLAGDVTPPIVSSVVIWNNGDEVTITFDESVDKTGYTPNDFDLDCSVTGDNIALTALGGSGTSHTFTPGSTIQSGETCNLDFNGAANSVEDLSGNDLAVITNQATLNYSQIGEAWACGDADILCESFDENDDDDYSKYDNNNSVETPNDGAIDADSSNAAMEFGKSGSECVHLTYTANAGTPPGVSWDVGSDYDKSYIEFYYHFPTGHTLAASTRSEIISKVTYGAGSLAYAIYIYRDGTDYKFRVSHTSNGSGTVYDLFSTLISSGNTYGFRIYFDGSNAASDSFIVKIDFDGDGIFDKQTISDSSTGAGRVLRVFLATATPSAPASDNGDVIIDNIKINSTDPGW